MGYGTQERAIRTREILYNYMGYGIRKNPQETEWEKGDRQRMQGMMIF